MSNMKITVTMDYNALMELRMAAGEGYGEGDFYGMNHAVKYRPAGWKRRYNALMRGFQAIDSARLAICRHE